MQSIIQNPDNQVHDLEDTKEDRPEDIFVDGKNVLNEPQIVERQKSNFYIANLSLGRVCYNLS